MSLLCNGGCGCVTLSVSQCRLSAKVSFTLLLVSHILCVQSLYEDLERKISNALRKIVLVAFHTLAIGIKYVTIVPFYLVHSFSLGTVYLRPIWDECFSLLPRFTVLFWVK